MRLCRIWFLGGFFSRSNRFFLQCNHVKYEWNWQPRHQTDRTLRVNKSHVFIFLKSSLSLFFIFNFPVPFLRSLSEELMITTISDYNWYAVWCSFITHMKRLSCFIVEYLVSHFFWMSYLCISFFGPNGSSQAQHLDFVTYANEIVPMQKNQQLIPFANVCKAQPYASMFAWDQRYRVGALQINVLIDSIWSWFLWYSFLKPKVMSIWWANSKNCQYWKCAIC